MKILATSAVALLAFTGVAQAQLAVDMTGSIKSTFTSVDDNVTEQLFSVGGPTFGNAPFAAMQAASGPNSFSTGGTTRSANTEVELNFDIRGQGQGFVQSYGGDIDLEGGEQADLSVERVRVFVVTPLGGLVMGLDPAGNRSADQVAVGESGVSTEPLGREYADQLAGPGISYGIKLAGVSAGITTDITGDSLSYSLGYAGETLSDVEYDVFFRGYHNKTPELDGPSGPTQIATRAEGIQLGAKVAYNNIKVAASWGKDEGADYTLLNAGGANAILNGALALDPSRDDVNREWWNIGAAYTMSGITVSADYDHGEISAPWQSVTTAETRAGVAAPISTHEYSAYSVGAAYELAPGLTLGAGYKVFNEVIALDLDTNPMNPDFSGLLNGGLKMKDRSELAASIKLAF